MKRVAPGSACVVWPAGELAGALELAARRLTCWLGADDEGQDYAEVKALLASAFMDWKRATPAERVELQATVEQDAEAAVRAVRHLPRASPRVH